MRNRIITQAENACSRSEVAHAVLSAVVETHAEPGDVQLEDMKSLLVDAVQAWRARNGVRKVATAMSDFVGDSPQAVHA